MSYSTGVSAIRPTIFTIFVANGDDDIGAIALTVGNRQMKRRFFGVRMKHTMSRLLALIGFLIGIATPAAAQDAADVLLPRINNLRAAKGLPAYAIHASLTAAANNHARWMALTGEISHQQHDGSGPRTRAVNAGFPSNWVSENIYRGASAMTAWEWWLNSPTHYAGLVSPYYDRIGIGSASGSRGKTYVVLFGNSTGRLLESGASAGSGGGGSAGGQPSFVLGLDEVGNIKHEVQPGQTIGHILLIYGYTWDEYPYLLEINGMSEADRLNMQPGSVILVPPQAGTYTPAPTVTSAAATATAAPTSPATEAAAPAAATSTKAATALPSPAPRAEASATQSTFEIRIAPIEPQPPQPHGITEETSAATSAGQLIVLGLALLLQLSALGAAGIALWRRSR